MKSEKYVLIKPLLRSKERSKWKNLSNTKRGRDKAREEGKKLETNVK
jgi:hypothetical protein